MTRPFLPIWLKGASLAVLLVAAVACNTTNKPAATAEVPVQNTEPSAAPAEEKIEVEVAEEELVYDPDSLVFDIRLSAALRSADSTMFLKTPSGVNLNEIPDDLDKWLSRIRDNGGTVKAAPLPADGKPSRSLLGILIDVVLFFVGLAKDEIIFSAADDFNALMYFDQSTGDVRWIVFTRRE